MRISDKIQKFLADRIVQYGILSAFVGLMNFFMLISLYANQLLNINPFLMAPLVIVVVLVLSWAIVEKWGFIRMYYERQHRNSPVILEQLERLERIEKKIEELNEKEHKKTDK